MKHTTTTTYPSARRTPKRRRNSTKDPNRYIIGAAKKAACKNYRRQNFNFANLETCRRVIAGTAK